MSERADCKWATAQCRTAVERKFYCNEKEEKAKHQSERNERKKHQPATTTTTATVTATIWTNFSYFIPRNSNFCFDAGVRFFFFFYFATLKHAAFAFPPKTVFVFIPFLFSYLNMQQSCYCSILLHCFAFPRHFYRFWAAFENRTLISFALSIFFCVRFILSVLRRVTVCGERALLP